MRVVDPIKRKNLEREKRKMDQGASEDGDAWEALNTEKSPHKRREKKALYKNVGGPLHSMDAHSGGPLQDLKTSEGSLGAL